MQELDSFPQCKVQRKRAAQDEIKHWLKQEQKKVWEEGHQEHLQRPAEREEVLEKANWSSW